MNYFGSCYKVLEDDHSTRSKVYPPHSGHTCRWSLKRAPQLLHSYGSDSPRSALVNAVLTCPRVLIAIHLCGVLIFHNMKVLCHPIVTSHIKKLNKNESTVFHRERGQSTLGTPRNGTQSLAWTTGAVRSARARLSGQGGREGLDQIENGNSTRDPYASRPSSRDRAAGRCSSV